MEISRDRLKQLLDAERKLNALEAGGVDNWEFYGEALSSFFKEEEREELIEEYFESIMEELSLGAYEPSERGAGYTFHKENEEKALDILKKLIDALNKLAKDS